MALHKDQQLKLKAQAHSLKPVVMIGANGLTDNVLAEIGQALDHHELIKIKIAGADKAARQEITEAIVKATQAHLITVIGQMTVLYRKRALK